MSRLERKILEELIYERVRVTIDLCDLLDFQSDLSASIERALRVCTGNETERASLTLDYLQRAWERVAGEVQREMNEKELLASAMERPEEGARRPDA